MRSLLGAFFALVSSGLVHADLNSQQSAWSYYNQTSYYLAGDVFTFNDAVSLQDIQFSAVGIGQANLVSLTSIRTELFVAKFAGLGSTPNDLINLWSVGFNIPAINSLTSFEFQPNITLGSGQYVFYALPYLPGRDASSAQITLQSNFANEAEYSYSVISGSYGPWGTALPLNGPFSLGGTGSSAFSLQTSLVSPVVEPESYAMLLAGLCLIGAVARRRKAQQG